MKRETSRVVEGGRRTTAKDKCTWRVSKCLHEEMEDGCGHGICWAVLVPNVDDFHHAHVITVAVVSQWEWYMV